MLVMEKVEPPWFVLIRCDLSFFGSNILFDNMVFLLFSALLVCLDKVRSCFFLAADSGILVLS